ncbi:MAG: sigma-70 family RNA polymerase sigma factor [Methyloceanibacter sp.]|jgi:RNA polymerase sigma-70 factor (ECF subfamily)
MEETADQVLMARIANGDEAAFRLLSRRHAARALGFAQRIVQNHASAEEVVQEALLRVWINAPRWRSDAPFQAWFFRIVLNLCLNQKRRPAFVSLESAGEPPDPGPDAVRQIEARELDQAIAAAIDALPDRQRTAILLTYHEGLSNAETAALLDTSVSAVETLLARAKRTLRMALAGHAS